MSDLVSVSVIVNIIKELADHMFDKRDFTLVVFKLQRMYNALIIQEPMDFLANAYKIKAALYEVNELYNSIVLVGVKRSPLYEVAYNNIYEQVNCDNCAANTISVAHPDLIWRDKSL